MSDKLRPAVSRFADRINQRMDLIDDEGAWHEVATSKLLSATKGYIAQLEECHTYLLAGITSPEMYAKVVEAAADAAAGLMMIADNVELGRHKAVLA